MGIFGQSTPFDADIDKATSETNTNENWSLILDVCDKVTSYPRSSKDCLKAIMKRMGHADPHVVMQAITLLDACASNCGKPFHLEIASRDFENEFRRLLTKAQPKVSVKMRQVLKNWAENDFKNDPELNLIPSLYNKLRHEGYDFSNLNEKPTKSPVLKTTVIKDPSMVSSQQEEDDIAKAIELSLKESKGSPKHQGGNGNGAGGGGGAGAGAAAATTTASAATAYPSLYPSFAGSGSGSLGSITSTGAASNNSASSQPEPRKVRALYDFEAAEENELTFLAGDIIHVLDDSDPNWWKGYNERGDGLFPSNFVTADLSVEPERLDINQQGKSKKNVQFEDDAKDAQQKTEAAELAAANQRIEIDEAKIDRLLHLLHEANPEDPSQDSDEMLRLEQEVHQMGPLIDAELERVDRKHAQLTQLSSDLVDAINLYHSLMRDDRAGAFMPAAAADMGMMGTLPGMPYQAPPNALYGAAGYPGNFASLPPSRPWHAPVMPMQSQVPVPIPMQFQNGHINGTINAALPPHMGASVLPGQNPQQQAQQQQQPPTTHMYNPTLPPPQQQQQQLQQQQQPTQTNYQMLPQQYAAPPTTTTTPHTTSSTGQPQPQHHQQQQPPQPQQQQQLQAQFMSPQHQQAPGPIYMPQPPPPQQQQQQQQVPLQQQHQQLPPQSGYVPTAGVPLPNGPQSYMNMAAQVGVAPGAMLTATTSAMPMPNGNNNNTNSNHGVAVAGDQYSQMLAIATGGMHPHPHQPVTQNFLVQNETSNNIPIYQQQR